MCGIIGYVGEASALPILLDGLRRLEYRGYDSAGIAVLGSGQTIVRKCAGRIDSLGRVVVDLDGVSRIGIGHTRWATHGPPTDENAHPHCDCDSNVAVVHNGIIENHVALRGWLEQRGHRFWSATDTEVIPHLIEEYVREGRDLEQAVRMAAERLEGSYAVAALSPAEPDRVVVVRQSSPLVVGLGRGETLVASDIPAVLRRTRDVIILEDGDVAVLTRDGVRITSLNGGAVSRPRQQVEWDAEQAERGGMPHYMLKEIHEQPDAIANTLRGRLDVASGEIFAAELGLGPDFTLPERIQIVACGTAYHAGLVGKHVIERLARIPVTVHLGSEFRYQDPIVDQRDLVIAISQSGETADTLASLREARARRSQVLAVSNVVGSSVAREADMVLYTRAGPEVAVAATKTYTCQLAALSLLAIKLAEMAGTLDSGQARALGRALTAIPRLAAALLTPEAMAPIVRLAELLAATEDCFFLGRGVDYAVAQEGQLKMKEISYVHAEALAAGELKHGTLALIEPGTFVIASVTQPELFDKAASNLAQVQARQGTTVVLTTDDHDRELGDMSLLIPAAGHPLLAPILAAIPLQLLAYHTGVSRGCDVDKPRNLAKSVTVE